MRTFLVGKMVNGQYLPTNSEMTKFLQEKITTTEHKVRVQAHKRTEHKQIRNTIVLLI